MQETRTVVSPTVKELQVLTPKQREEIDWYHEAGMPAQGTVVDAIRQSAKVRKERP